jgi:hypothetical protein
MTTGGGKKVASTQQQHVRAKSNTSSVGSVSGSSHELPSVGTNLTNNSDHASHAGGPSFSTSSTSLMESGGNEYSADSTESFEGDYDIDPLYDDQLYNEFIESASYLMGNLTTSGTRDLPFPFFSFIFCSFGFFSRFFQFFLDVFFSPFRHCSDSVRGDLSPSRAVQHHRHHDAPLPQHGHHTRGPDFGH